MFGRHKEIYPKRGIFLVFTIFRVGLSLVMLMILAFAAYKALVHFSGVNPLNIDPKNALISVAWSNQSASFIKVLLNARLPENIDEVKAIIKDPASIGTILKPTGLVDDLDLQTAPMTVPQNKVLTFAIVADSHNDNANLKKALSQAKAKGVKFVIGVGDYTQVGSVDELTAAKQVFDSQDLPYYLTSGDHDFWAAIDRNLNPSIYFTSVFGSPYQSFSDSNIRFIIVNNADNYNGVDQVQEDWLLDEIKRVSEASPRQLFVFLHEPLAHPSSDHFMGKISNNVRDQALKLSQLFKETSVGEVFAGDSHFFTRYTGPNGLKMTTVGAITESRNAQTPRYVVVDVYEDGSYNVIDTEVDSK